MEIDLQTTGCKGQSNEINFIEHVQIELDMEYTKRGDLAINLTSAMGKGDGILHLTVDEFSLGS